MLQPTDIIDTPLRVIKSLWQNPGVSRVDLAESLSMDKSTLSRVTGKLLESGLIEEVSEKDASPKGGRRPVRLEVRPDWGLWLGTEILPHGSRSVLVDFTGKIRSRFSEEMVIQGNNLKEALKLISLSARQEAEKLNIPLKGAGLAIPGPVRPGTAVVERSHPLRIDTPLNLATLGEEILELPTLVDKDVNCGCLGETRFTSQLQSKNLIYLLAEPRQQGLALGLAIMIDGRLIRGDHGASGEIISVFRNDNKYQIAVDEKDLTRAKSDPQVLTEVVKELMPQIGFLANALDIDKLILAGLFQRDFTFIGPLFEKELKRRKTYSTLSQATVIPAVRGEDAVAYGAGIHFTENPTEQHFWRNQ